MSNHDYSDDEVFQDTYPVTVKEYRTGDKGIYQSGIRTGVKAERERIIKLLENEITRVSNPMLVDREYLDGLEQSIALIKGENK